MAAGRPKAGLQEIATAKLYHILKKMQLFLSAVDAGKGCRGQFFSSGLAGADAEGSGLQPLHFSRRSGIIITKNTVFARRSVGGRPRERRKV